MLELFRDTWRSFRKHDGPLLSASVAFYMLLATAPLGVFAVVVTSVVLGEEAARGELLTPLQTVLGHDAARFVQDLVERASEPAQTRLAAAVGLGFFVVAVTRLFLMLQAALNHIWGVRARATLGFRGDAWRVTKKRMIAFSMVFVLGATFFLFALAKTVLSTATGSLQQDVPTLWRVLELLLSLGVGTLLNAIVFKLLPDVHIEWRDVFLGAFVTTVLSAAGAYVIGVYLGRASAGSMYGAAGSIVVLLLWVYYTAHIFFLGAEFTGAWARHKGHGITPLPHAVSVVEERDEPIEPETRITLLGLDDEDEDEPAPDGEV